MCYFDADEPCQIWEEAVVIARKDHVCDCCDGATRKGAPYTRHHNLYDGQWTFEKMCGPCSIACEQFSDSHGSRLQPSAMWEVIESCAAEGDEDSRRWLLVSLGMRRRQKVRLAKVALEWRPALPPRGRRAEVAHVQ